ncbi:MAG: hypothetical protein GF329_15760 [Candidatus Lokiarchaeota archaeon]|nr:hypothetical protein [Candidatus Lokiarchaeota archaeon]
MADFLSIMLSLFQFFADNASITLTLAGLTAGSWLFIRIFQGKREEDEKIRWTEVVAIILGVIVGIFSTAAGFIAWSGSFSGTGTYSVSTIVILIIVGLGLLLKPVKDLPWAAIIGIIFGLIVISMISFQMTFILDLFEGLGFNPYWIMLIIFLLILLMSYMAFKLIEDIGKIMGKVLSWGPLQAAVMFFCLFEAILLIWPPPGFWSIATLFGF